MASLDFDHIDEWWVLRAMCQSNNLTILPCISREHLCSWDLIHTLANYCCQKLLHNSVCKNGTNCTACTDNWHKLPKAEGGWGQLFLSHLLCLQVGLSWQFITHYRLNFNVRWHIKYNKIVVDFQSQHKVSYFFGKLFLEVITKWHKNRKRHVTGI